MAELPPEADRLLATAPDEFVDERTRLARALRGEGRAEEAKVVAGLRKPPAVVLAVNRAARDRSQAAADAVDAARRLGRAQLEGDAEAFREASADVERTLELLADVAVAQLSRGRDSASEAMRRRVRELLRAALAGETTRDALVRGVLREEEEARGFEAFEGMPLPKAKKRSSRRAAEKDREDETRARRELESRIEEARKVLRRAERRVQEAMRERDEAAEALAALEAERRRS